jgi:hypothetical protein
MISASKHQVIILDKPSVDDAGSVMQMDDAYVIPEWARYVIEYLKNGQLPNDKKKLKKSGRNQHDTLLSVTFYIAEAIHSHY